MKTTYLECYDKMPDYFMKDKKNDIKTAFNKTYQQKR
jgi:hypothetical protein